MRHQAITKEAGSTMEMAKTTPNLRNSRAGVKFCHTIEQLHNLSAPRPLDAATRGCCTDKLKNLGWMTNP